MSAEENKSLVLRWVEEGWVKKNLAAAEDFYASDYVLHLPGFPEVHGPEEVRQLIGSVQSAFPDLKLTVDENSLVADDEKVAGRSIVTGTHQKDFMGIAATGKSVSWEGLSILRIAGGKFVEEWELMDMAGLLQQLGVISIPK